MCLTEQAIVLQFTLPLAYIIPPLGVDAEEQRERTRKEEKCGRRTEQKNVRRRRLGFAQSHWLLFCSLQSSVHPFFDTHLFIYVLLHVKLIHIITNSVTM